ncbi:glycosyltransferase involved in cell wall biosynthesis [Mucilaginibacter sp. UYP25]|uniref:glycosyltransferase family 4 protein n=1 Tax=unclassified Mucilaginibacter TaxID=2617802 RepID=UPI003391966A
MKLTSSLLSNKPSLCIDARMIQHSGIGMYLRMLLPIILPKYNSILLGDPALLSAYSDSAKIISFLPPIYSISEQKQYRKLIPKCDLFWSPHYNVPLFVVQARKRVATIHDVFHLAFIKQLSIKQKIYAKLVINRALSASDQIITVSNFSKDEIIRFGSAKGADINVIYNGVKQYPMVGNWKDVKAKYKLPSQYILYVGNVKPHKNLQTLAEAYLKLSEELKETYKIVVVGKIDGFITGDEDLLRIINNNDILKRSIVFTGFVDDDDMDTIYAKASVFVLPSLYEGFGLPPLEAMLNKCPVLVSNQNSLPEVCGDAALYFDPHDPADIAAQMEKVLSDQGLHSSLVTNGTKRVKYFTWDKSAQQHINLFNKLIYS